MFGDDRKIIVLLMIIVIAIFWEQVSHSEIHTTSFLPLTDSLQRKCLLVICLGKLG